MNRRRIAAAAVTPALALAMVAPAADATTQRVSSGPAGHFNIASSVLAVTNADGDGDPDTVTTGDTVTAFYAVRNTTGRRRTVTITVQLDAPGTAADQTLTEQRVIRPGARYREEITYDVTAEFPRGEYVVRVTATQAAETGTAAAQLLIQ